MSKSASAGGSLGEGPPPAVPAAVRQGYLWNMLNFLFSQGAGVVIFVVLSRTLSPAIFGVFALAALVVDLFTLQGRWAAMDALVQRQDFSRLSLSSAFFALTGIAVVIVLAAVAAAGWVAEAFEMPSLAGVLPALALTILLAPATVVMDALLMRRLQFRAQAIRSIIGTLLGGGIGIAVAFSPAVEWALVAQRLAGSLITLGVLFAFTRWTPSLEFDAASAAGFLRRAGQLWGTTVLASAHTRIVEAFVGLRSGAVAVGLIAIARRFETLLHGPVTGPIQGLWVPVLSALRNDRAQSWRLFLRLSQLTALIALPAFVGLALVADDLIIVVFDERYAAAGPVLMAVALSGVFMPAGFFANLVFAGLDRSDLSLKFSLAVLVLCIPVLWFASGFGPVVALLAAALVVGLAGIVATGVQIRMLHGSAGEFLSALMPGYSGVAAMTAALIALRYALPIQSAVAELCVHVAIGASIYLAWLWFFHRNPLLEAWRFFSQSRAEVVEAEAAAERLQSAS